MKRFQLNIKYLATNEKSNFVLRGNPENILNIIRSQWNYFYESTSTT